MKATKAKELTMYGIFEKIKKHADEGENSCEFDSLTEKQIYMLEDDNGFKVYHQERIGRPLYIPEFYTVS